MRVALGLAVAFSVVAMTAQTSFAQTGPVIVVPSRPGVPIYINGLDASYGVVEGDWGLARSVHVTPTVTYAPIAFDPPPPPVGHYYPSFGIMPGYGRKEVQPDPRRRPQRAQSYSRVWGAESMPLPAQTDPPVNPPAVIYAPEVRSRPHRR